MRNITDNRTVRTMALIIVLALIIGVVWGLASADENDRSDNPIASLDSSPAVDPIGGDEDADSGSATVADATNTTDRGTSTDATGDASQGPPASSDPTPSEATRNASLSVIELVLTDQCAVTVQPQVAINVSTGSGPGQFVDSGVLPPTELAFDEPVTVLDSERFTADADDWTVTVSAREHLLGASASRSDSTPGSRSIDLPANNSHRDWVIAYEITESEGEVSVDNVELRTTCEETVVPQVLVTIDRGNGPEVLTDTGAGTQRSLVSGDPLPLTERLDLGELDDGWTVRILVNEHFVGRQYQAAHTAPAVVDTQFPGTAVPPGPWQVRYTIDAS